MTALIAGKPASHWLTLMVAKVGEPLTDRNGEPLTKDRTRYVGRGPGKHGKFGNPFSHKSNSAARWQVGSVEEAVQAHRLWLLAPEQAQLLADVRAELAGKVLTCYCQVSEAVGPPCHAETLVRLANPKLAAMEAAEQAQVTPRKLDLAYGSHFKAWCQRNGLDDRPKVLITGARDFGAAEVISQRLSEFAPGHVVIEGEARGADRLARDAALKLGLPVAGFPAQWTPTRQTPAHRIRRGANGHPYDVGAGPIRNAKMLDCDPDLVLAFHDDLNASKGTKDMLIRAIDKGTKVILSDSAGSFMPLDREELVSMAGLVADADVDD